MVRPGSERSPPNPNGQLPQFQFQLPPQDHQYNQEQMNVIHDNHTHEEAYDDDLSPPFEAYNDNEENQQDKIEAMQQPNGYQASPYPPPQTPPPSNYPPDQGYMQPQVYPPPAEPVEFPPPQSQATYQEPVQLPRPPQSQAYQRPTASVGPTPNIAAGVPLAVATNMWSSDLFDCFDDPELAVLTAFCPCVTFGHIAEIIDSGQTSCATSGFLYGAIVFVIALPCLMSCSYRSKLRSRYNLVESPADDWIIHCFCECCALCQEYRELQQRGFDPSIGWAANVAKDQMLQQQQQPNGMAPPANQTMMRP